MKSSQIILSLALVSLPCFTACTYPSGVKHRMPETTAQFVNRHWSGRVPVAMPVEGPVEGTPVHGVPVQLPGRATWISSFVITKEASIFRDADPFSEGGLAGSGIAHADQNLPPQLHSIDVRWHDALFSNGHGSESWSLLNRRGFISNWWIMAEVVDGFPRTQFNVFSAVVRDTNGDKVLNNKDAGVAIFTDGSGRNIEVATPEDMQLVAVHYRADVKMLGFEVREDKDGDGTFASDEPIHLYFRYPFEEKATTKPWHTPNFQESLEQRYR